MGGGWLDDGLSGFVSGSFLLSSAWRLESRARAIFADHGLEGEFHFNYAYAGAGVTAKDMLPVLAAAGLVLAAGPPLLAAGLVPWLCYRSQVRVPLVDRLRTEE